MQFHESPVMHPIEISLKVMNLDKMIDFYETVIGFDVLEQSESLARLGIGGKPILQLENGNGNKPALRQYAGLYHFALLVPDRAELGKALVHLVEQNIPLGSADHLVSEALYLSDPEGNGIEIYTDRNPAAWEWNAREVKMAVAPLNAESLIEEAIQTGESWKKLPDKTVLGHMHLHVADLEAAREFYVKSLGLEVVAEMDGALFLSDGRYHHHLGVNTWKGTGISGLPEKTAGLAYWSLAVSSKQKKREIVKRLETAGYDMKESMEWLEVTDPSGNKLRLVTR